MFWIKWKHWKRRKNRRGDSFFFSSASTWSRTFLERSDSYRRWNMRIEHVKLRINRWSTLILLPWSSWNFASKFSCWLAKSRNFRTSSSIQRQAIRMYAWLSVDFSGHRTERKDQETAGRKWTTASSSKNREHEIRLSLQEVPHVWKRENSQSFRRTHSQVAARWTTSIGWKARQERFDSRWSSGTEAFEWLRH